MKSLFIIRGLPGAGKTTFAQQVADVVCSADDFFTNDGKYFFFDAGKIKDAHAYCVECVKKNMLSGTDKIAVANTSTQHWEWEQYEKLAKKYGYMIFHIIVENRNNNKNVHGVPDIIIEKMRERFEIKL